MYEKWGREREHEKEKLTILHLVKTAEKSDVVVVVVVDVGSF